MGDTGHFEGHETFSTATRAYLTFIGMREILKLIVKIIIKFKVGEVKPRVELNLQDFEY